MTNKCIQCGEEMELSEHRCRAVTEFRLEELEGVERPRDACSLS